MDTPEVKSRKKRARRKWREANQEKDLASQRRRRQANPERAREVVRKWRAENPDRARELSRKSASKWAKNHPENRKAQNHKRHALKLGSTGAFTGKEWAALKIATGNACLCCRRSEGMLLTLGLKLVPDHIVALANNGSNAISNIQPLCHGKGGCNNKKSSKTKDYRKTQVVHGDEI
jgi:hypothetical protein